MEIDTINVWNKFAYGFSRERERDLIYPIEVQPVNKSETKRKPTRFYGVGLVWGESLRGEVKCSLLESMGWKGII